MNEDGPGTIRLSFPNRAAISRLVDVARKWSAEHPAFVQGAAEMAISAALLSWGVHSGTIEMGMQLVGTASNIANVGVVAGAVTLGALGLSAAKLVGLIGIVGMGSAIGVPAALLATGGAAALGALGYTAGDLAFSYLHAFRPQDFVVGAGALVIGLALMADGARRILGDDAVRQSLALIGEKFVQLRQIAAEIVAQSTAELTAYERNAGTAGIAAVAGIGGVVAGGAYAVSTVTLFGSSTLGAAAISVGLVTAPVWPVVLGGTAAAVAGGLLAKHLLKKRYPLQHVSGVGISMPTSRSRSR